MALMRRLLVAAQYAAALECARRPAIARITAAATGCVTIKANAADVPMLGRFARNEGAKEFVGDWRVETTTGVFWQRVSASDRLCTQLADVGHDAAFEPSRWGAWSPRKKNCSDLVAMGEPELAARQREQRVMSGGAPMQQRARRGGAQLLAGYAGGVERRRLRRALHPWGGRAVRHD